MQHDRDAELIRVAAGVLAGLVAAHERGDVAAAAAEIGTLLQAVAQYTGTPTERRDAALRRAISRL